MIKLAVKAIINYRFFVFSLLKNLGLYKNVFIKKNIKMNQAVNFVGKGCVKIGNNVILGCIPSPFKKMEIYLESRGINSSINIGDNVAINNNACIIAEKGNISIGEGTLIGINFMCVDSNFHGIHPMKRITGEHCSKDVKIGKNVFIGNNVTILRGSVIGDNSVIGAGCVISGIFPGNVIVSVSSNHKVEAIIL
ncbi:acyltransferase [Pectobacterium punjabense]|uniref:acyltransferase n=1 Tax=Pectobacterium punjabense TaxID=2108399 RepID=UPI002406D7DF|nr:acyltransferase [Pectobacterium punjabense]MDG0796882.1 acyltransferase [Pectobacterium punjabense]